MRYIARKTTDRTTPQVHLNDNGQPLCRVPLKLEAHTITDDPGKQWILCHDCRDIMKERMLADDDNKPCGLAAENLRRMKAQAARAEA